MSKTSDCKGIRPISKTANEPRAIFHSAPGELAPLPEVEEAMKWLTEFYDSWYYNESGCRMGEERVCPRRPRHNQGRAGGLREISANHQAP